MITPNRVPLSFFPMDEERSQLIIAPFHEPPTSARFPDNAKSFRAWQRLYRANLAAWLMGGGWPERVPLESRVMATEDRLNFTVRMIEYRSQADRTNTA